MFRFEELDIWRLAVEYGKECYTIAANFPKHEMYALADQLRRAAISISNNIAEGSVGSNMNFQKHLVTAVGSTLETVNILNFSFETGYITEKVKIDMYAKAETFIKMIHGFSKSLER